MFLQLLHFKKLVVTEKLKHKGVTMLTIIAETLCIYRAPKRSTHINTST